jgi:putative PIN family toxin of toxin-antitoxin system
MRATLDTNVLVSALEFGGIPGQLLDLNTDEAFTLCTSPAIIAELTRVLAERFEWAEDDIHANLTPIVSRAHVVEPTAEATASPDPDDNRILECAVESRSDVIVTGDDHLLRLGTFEGIPIVTPRDFYESVLRMK